MDRLIKAVGLNREDMKAVLAEVKRIKEAPAAEPAHDEFRRAFKPETTDKKVANAVSIAGARR